MAIVTYEAVVAAAESLLAENQKASVRKVTERIGGGSPNTVLKMLNDWKNGRPIVRASEIEIDPAISAAIVAQMKKIIGDAAVAAEERVSTASDDLAVLMESNLSLEQQVERLAGDLAASTTAIEQLVSVQHDQQLKFAGDLDALKAKLAELTTDLDKERDRANASQQALGKAEARAEAMPALEQRIEHLTTALDAERTARAAAEQRAAVADAQVKLVSEQAAKTSIDADKQIEQLKAAADKADQAHAEAVAQLRRDIEDYRSEVREAAAELKAARVQIDTLRDQLAAAAKTSSIEIGK